MPSLACLVLDRAPYGSLQPAEAIRHAGGALGKGWGVILAFMGAGVYTALPGQSPPAGEWISLSQALAELIESGKERVQVLVDRDSLDTFGLSADDLVFGLKPVPLEEMARAVAGCDRALIF